MAVNAAVSAAPSSRNILTNTFNSSRTPSERMSAAVAITLTVWYRASPTVCERMMRKNRVLKKMTTSRAMVQTLTETSISPRVRTGPAGAAQPAGPAQVVAVVVLAVRQEGGQIGRLAADAESVAGLEPGAQVDLGEEMVGAADRDVNEQKDVIATDDLLEGAAAQVRTAGDGELGDLEPLGVGAGAFDEESAQGLAGQGLDGQQRRDQRGSAEGEDVGDGFAEPADEVFVEDAQDDADVGRRVEGADDQGSGDVDQIVADGQDDAATGANAGLLEHLRGDSRPERARAAEAGVVRSTPVVDSDDLEAGGPKEIEDAPADASEPAQDNRFVHGVSSRWGLWKSA